MTTSTISRQLLSRLGGKNLFIRSSTTKSASLSTQAKPWYYDNPSQIVAGTTTEDLENNPVLAEYFAHNFSEPPPSVQSLKLENNKSSEEEEALKDDPLAALNIRRLKCHPRDRQTEDGSRVCRRMREIDRMIPGLLYGADPIAGISSADKTDSRVWVKTPLSEIQRERDRYHHHFESRVYELTMEDPDSGDVISTQRVVPSDVNMHPVLNKAYCVNYLRYHPGRVLSIPIQYINEEESPALKRGGFIVPINRYLKCIVDEGVPIPESIELDCTGIRLKEKVRMDRLIIPDGVRVSKSVNQKDFLVGPVMGRGA